MIDNSYKQHQPDMDTSFYQDETEGYPFLAEVCIFLHGLSFKPRLPLELHDALVDLNTAVLVENFLFDDYSGYDKLFKYLQNECSPVSQWKDLKLLNGFLDNVESICNSGTYIDNLLYTLIKCVQETYTSIEFAQYYGKGLEYLYHENYIVIQKGTYDHIE